MPMWDRTREVIDIRLQNAQPAAVLEDSEATSVALLRAMAFATAADSCGAARSVTERTTAHMKTREQFGQPITGFQALKRRDEVGQSVGSDPSGEPAGRLSAVSIEGVGPSRTEATPQPSLAASSGSAGETCG